MEEGSTVAPTVVHVEGDETLKQVDEEIARVKSAHQQNGKHLARLLLRGWCVAQPRGALVRRRRSMQIPENPCIKVSKGTSWVPDRYHMGPNPGPN